MPYSEAEVEKFLDDNPEFVEALIELHAEGGEAEYEDYRDMALHSIEVEDEIEAEVEVLSDGDDDDDDGGQDGEHEGSAWS